MIKSILTFIARYPILAIFGVLLALHILGVSLLNESNRLETSKEEVKKSD